MLDAPGEAPTVLRRERARAVLLHHTESCAIQNVEASIKRTVPAALAHAHRRSVSRSDHAREVGSSMTASPDISRVTRSVISINTPTLPRYLCVLQAARTSENLSFSENSSAEV